MNKPDLIIKEYENNHHSIIELSIWIEHSEVGLSGRYYMSNWDDNDSPRAFWCITPTKTLRFKHTNGSSSWGDWSYPASKKVINAIESYIVENIIFGDNT